MMSVPTEARGMMLGELKASYSPAAIFVVLFPLYSLLWKNMHTCTLDEEKSITGFNDVRVCVCMSVCVCMHCVYVCTCVCVCMHE